MRIRNYHSSKVFQEDRLEDVNLRAKKLNTDTDKVIGLSCGVSNKPSCRTSLFSSDDVDTDTDEWKNKPPEEWNEGDTKNWLIWVSEEHGFAYGRIPCELVIPGRELLTLKRSDLIELDSAFGKKLYDLLRQRSCKTSLFRSDDVDIDEDDWKSKPVEEWKEIDTKEWLISKSKKMGIAYGALPCELGISGQELVSMKRPDFIRLAPTFGEKLYDLLQELPCRRSLFRSDDVGIDEDDWESKPVEEWKKIDTKKWLISTSTKLGIAYGALPCELGISGRELDGMKHRDFIRLAPTFGGSLYDLLRERGVRIQQQAERNKDGLKSSKKQLGPGRPRVQKTKPNKKSERVWQFVVSLLHDPQHCPAVIRWENYEERTIRFVDTKAIGKLWGEKKNNKLMDYRKFSRALRHYRHRGTFVAVNGMRLVYKFGKNTPGLETDDPNFTIANRKKK